MIQVRSIGNFLSLARAVFGHLRCAARISAIASLLLFLAGCMTNQAPRFEMDAAGEKIMAKRFEKNIRLDWFRHQTRRIYTPNDAEIHDPLLTNDQREIQKRLGKPEYIRGEFRSDTDEIVTEWVFYEKGRVAQFVEGTLVYEGPVSDYETTLIRRGRPDEAFSIPGDREHPRSDTLIYNGIFRTDLDAYHFSNSKLAAAAIHNP